MAEVYKKIQKTYAEEMVNHQYELHKEYQQRMAEMAEMAERAQSEMIKKENMEFGLLFDGEWFSIHRNPQSIKIIISTDSLQEW